MKQQIKLLSKHYNKLCLRAYARSTSFVIRHTTAILLIVGMTFLSAGVHSVSEASVSIGGSISLSPSLQYNDRKIRIAVCQLFNLIEGAFGGLIMTVAGIGAVIAAAFGSYRVGYGLIVTGVGAFILRSLISLFFGVFSCSEYLEFCVSAGIGGPMMDICTGI